MEVGVEEMNVTYKYKGVHHPLTHEFCHQTRSLEMKASEGRVGRVFVIRLEHGDIIPDCIERFAEEKKISVGQVIMIGGIGEGQVVVGPRHSNEMPPEPMLVPVDGAHELIALGVIAPDKTNKPVLHVHGSLGRAGKATTGCLRPGVSTWTFRAPGVFDPQA